MRPIFVNESLVSDSVVLSPLDANRGRRREAGDVKCREFMTYFCGVCPKTGHFFYLYVNSQHCVTRRFFSFSSMTPVMPWRNLSPALILLVFCLLFVLDLFGSVVPVKNCYIIWKFVCSVSQTCDQDGMEFTLRTPEGFRGRIYTHNNYGRYEPQVFQLNNDICNSLFFLLSFLHPQQLRKVGISPKVFN